MEKSSNIVLFEKL